MRHQKPGTQKPMIVKRKTLKTRNSKNVPLLDFLIAQNEKWY